MSPVIQRSDASVHSCRLMPRSSSNNRSRQQKGLLLLASSWRVSRPSLRLARTSCKAWQMLPLPPHKPRRCKFKPLLAHITRSLISPRHHFGCSVMRHIRSCLTATVGRPKALCIIAYGKSWVCAGQFCDVDCALHESDCWLLLFMVVNARHVW